MKSLNQIDKNLLLFLDPIGRYSEKSWDFHECIMWGYKSLSPHGRNIIIRFPRECLFYNFIISFKLCFTRKKKCRRVLYINDGLLSSIFEATNVSAYRAYAKKHLPKPKTLRQRLISLLPLVLRAETQFIVEFLAQPQTLINNDSELSSLEENNFMFFANPAGKLLMTNTETLNTGHGQIIKTTTESDYAQVMAKEFDTVVMLSEKLGKAGCLPAVNKHFEINDRHFFTEGYVSGERLLERLHVLRERGDIVQICSILDGLDEWFCFYQASFSGNLKPVSELYSHLFPLFSDCYGNAGTTLLRAGVDLLSQFEMAHPFVMPIIAHNDLWPGNVVMTESGFTVIDWERATENRAPFFDFFWMVVSTTIESLRWNTENHKFSKTVGKILRCEDDVSSHAFHILQSYLYRSGITEQYLPHLFFLFFMEWSVQGYQVLGQQTAMDCRVFGDLLHYTNIMNLIQGECLNSDDLGARVFNA